MTASSLLCGIGGPQDVDEGARYAQLAAKKGHAAAQGLLTSCFLEVAGMSADPVKAVKWFRRAVQQGDVMAMTQLSRCLGKGLCGVEVDHRVKRARDVSYHG
jgi:TPR repeat protein